MKVIGALHNWQTGFQIWGNSLPISLLGICSIPWVWSFETDLNKMANFGQTTFSNAFSCQKMFVYWFKFSNSLKDQHWFRLTIWCQTGSNAIAWTSDDPVTDEYTYHQGLLLLTWIEAKTKWQTLPGQHFQMDFCKSKCMNFSLTFIEVCS